MGTALVLRRQPWVAHCLLAANIQQAVAMAARHRPEVALLDISNVGPFVPTATAQLSEAHPGIAIVLTSRCGGAPPGGPQALGARAFLPPGTSAREIVAAVRAAVLSADYPDAPLADRRIANLTDRDRELLLLISQGATNREIANHLHLGPDSIKKVPVRCIASLASATAPRPHRRRRTSSGSPHRNPTGPGAPG